MSLVHRNCEKEEIYKKNIQMAPKPEQPQDILLPKEHSALVPATELSETRVQVDDCIYDTAAIAAIHPGGELFVKAFSGRDATEAFLSYHRRKFPHDRVAHAFVGKRPRAKVANADDDYLELITLVDAVVPRHNSFAPWYYFVKIFFLFVAAVGLECYMHYHGFYVWYLTGALGLSFALIGLNIQHDGNHGAISRNSVVNRLLGLTQNWIGGSAIDWIHQVKYQDY
jgi:fatty acid desaturase (delta-4 desaturase)